MGKKNKNNKSGKNPFYHFMMEWKEQQRRNYNMRDVAAIAGKIWEKMGEEERSPYMEKAKREKGASAVVQQRVQQENNMKIANLEAEKALKKMNDEVDGIIQEAIIKNTIKQEAFCIMHVNNYVYVEADKKHYPAEIALVKFNLEEGVLEDNIYHEIIRPGEFPLGYSFKAIQFSKDTHQIPAPVGDTDSNLQEVMDCLVEFMSNLFGDEYPPIYVSVKDIKLVREVIHQLCVDFAFDYKLFKIHSLEYLLFTLKNCIAGETVWTLNESELEFSKDKYKYADGIACGLHEESDVLNRCSRSIAVRYAYIVCENCTPLVDIKLKPGKHIPTKSTLLSIQDLPKKDYYKTESHLESDIKPKLEPARKIKSESNSIPPIKEESDEDAGWLEEEPAPKKAKIDERIERTRTSNNHDASSSQLWQAPRKVYPKF